MTKPTVTSFGLGRVQGFGPGQDIGRIDGKKGAIPTSTSPIATSTRTAAFSPFNEDKIPLGWIYAYSRERPQHFLGEAGISGRWQETEDMSRRMWVFWTIVIVTVVIALTVAYWIFWVLDGPI
jgi:hypothetical protein